MTFVLGVPPVCRTLVFHSTLPIKMAEQTAPAAFQKAAVKVAGFSHPLPILFNTKHRRIRSLSSEWEECEETRCLRPWGSRGLMAV